MTNLATLVLATLLNTAQAAEPVEVYHEHLPTAVARAEKAIEQPLEEGTTYLVIDKKRVIVNARNQADYNKRDLTIIVPAGGHVYTFDTFRKPYAQSFSAIDVEMYAQEVPHVHIQKPHVFGRSYYPKDFEAGKKQDLEKFCHTNTRLTRGTCPSYVVDGQYDKYCPEGTVPKPNLHEPTKHLDGLRCFSQPYDLTSTEKALPALAAKIDALEMQKDPATFR